MSDLISRADAIEAVRGLSVLVDEDEDFSYFEDAIKALPSADAVDVAHDIPEYCSWSQTYTNMVQSAMSKASADAVQGEWEHWGSPFSDESEVIDTIVCSVCGARFIEPKDEPKGEYNYCPSCGARMKGGGE